MRAERERSSKDGSPCIAALAHASARAECGWRAGTSAPGLATRYATTAWCFTLSADIPWLGVIVLDDGRTWRWAKLSANLAEAVQTARLSLTTYTRFDAHELRIQLTLGGYYSGTASLAGPLCKPPPTPASQPVVAQCLKTGATVQFGTMVELASLRVAEGWSAWIMLIAEVDTESRWRGQWRVRTEIPGDLPPGLACLRDWRLAGEGEA